MNIWEADKTKQGEEPKTPLQFTVNPASSIVRIQTKPIVIKCIRIKQLGVLFGRAVTGHKLQGMPKDYLFCIKYYYSTANRMYVVFSRVITQNRLFLYN